MSLEVDEARRANGLEPAQAEGPVSTMRWIARTTLIATAIVVLAVASAVLVASFGATRYEARSEVLFQPGSGDVNDPARAVATQKALIESRAVLAAPARSVGVPVEEVEESLTVETGEDDLLRIAGTDESPARARRLTQQIAERYVALVSTPSSELARARDVVQRRVDELEARLEGASPADAGALADRIAALEDRMVELELQASRATITTPAFVLADPVAPKLVRAAAVGLLVGLALATGTVILLARNRARP